MTNYRNYRNTYDIKNLNSGILKLLGNIQICRKINQLSFNKLSLYFNTEAKKDIIFGNSLNKHLMFDYLYRIK